MSGPLLGSQLSLCPGGTYISPADRACDRFAIYTRYARYFAFSPPTCSAQPPNSAPPHCRTAPNPAPFSRNALLSPPPLHEKTSSGSPSVQTKRLPVHPRCWQVHPNLSPMMFEGLRGEFRWHLRSRHRGPKGRSGDTWAEDILHWLEEEGATGRRRSRSRSSICAFL